jgi:hypothetical protein
MKYIFILLVLCSSSGCFDAYYTLTPKPCNNEGSARVNNDTLYLYNDSLRIYSSTSSWGCLLLADSLWDFIMEIKTKKENLLFKNKTSCFVIDKKDSAFYPDVIKDYSYTGKADYPYTYNLVFSPKNRMVLPVEFNYMDLYNNKHKVSYAFEKAELYDSVDCSGSPFEAMTLFGGFNISFTSNYGKLSGGSIGINFDVNESSGIGFLLKNETSLKNYGTDDRVRRPDDIKRLNEYSIIYRYSFNEIIENLYVTGGMSFMWARKQNDRKIFYLSMPLRIYKNFVLENKINFYLGMAGNINNYTFFYGPDFGISIKL